MENVASSKAAIEAQNSGLTGVFEKLVQEHRELTELLLKLRMNSDPDLRARMFPRLQQQIVAHETAEASVLYVAMSKKEQTRLIANKHRRTAGELQRLTERLATLEYAGVNWEPTFNMLFDAFEQHAIEEESYYFPIAQRVLGTARAQLMYAHYEAALEESFERQAQNPH